MVKKVLVALVTVAFIQALLALCIVSALQLLVPRSTPFGVVGSSPVVSQVEKTTSLDTMTYPDESAAITAIDQGQLYGAYIAGTPGTLIVVPAKSFFAQIELTQAFAAAGKTVKTPFTVRTLKPLPQSDNIGAVVTFLLIPLLIGGYLAAVLVFKAAAGAAAPWRAAILTGYAIVGALLTDLIAGPLIGAYSSSHFWPLLPCFALVTTAVVLASAAIQGLVGKLGSLVVVVLFLILGGVSAGGLGVSLLPLYWQDIGDVFPPRNAVELIRNVLYFGGNNITTPLIVLFLWALAGLAVLGYLAWIRPAQLAAAGRHSAKAAAPVPAGRSPEPVAAPAPVSPGSGSGLAAGPPEPPGPPGPDAPGPAPGPKSPRSKALSRGILIALGVVAFMECLFAFNYMDAGHEAVATNMPFGVTGSSPILTQVEKTYSLRVTHYANEAAVKAAIGQARLYGALIPGTPTSTLIVVPTASDLAPLDLAVNFEKAAASQHQVLKVQQYAPAPLPKKDPFGLVPSLMLTPLLIGGYVCATLLRGATGEASGRWRGMILAGYAIGAALIVDLVVGLWLQGFPASSFWIVWPIASLITLVTALVAAVLQKLVGAAGTLLTTIVIMLFGNPSSGGANGVPYLPTFWRDIGPYLPPRNAYILLRNAIYFHGNGITQALTVLLIYIGVGALAIGLLDWFRSPVPDLVTPETEDEAVTMVIPIGVP